MDRRKILGILGTIVLGALGSGLWELAKPLGTTAWDAVLTVSTLGLDTLKDSLYQSASRLGSAGARQAAAIQLLAGLICLAAASVLMEIRFLRSENRNSISLSYLLPFVLLAGTGALLLGSVRSSYVAKVAAYHEQLTTIAAPYINAETRLQLASRAASAQGRKEYIAVLNELEQVLAVRGVKLVRLDLY